MIWRVGASVLAVLVGVMLMPASGRTQSLVEALVLTYTNNARLVAARADLRATDETVPQALAANRPTLQASASKGVADQRTHDVLTFATPHYSYRPTDYELTVTQPVWRGGRADLEENSALKQVYSARAGLTVAEETAFASTVSDYMNVLAGEQTVALSADNEQMLRSEIDAIDQQLRDGRLTRTDLAQASAALNQAVSSRAVAEGQLRAARATYLHDVGEPAATLTAPTDFKGMPASRDEAVARAEEYSPTVLQAQFALDSTSDQIESTRRELLPTVALQATVSHSTEAETIHTRTDNMQVLAEISIPLYDGGTTFSKSRALQATKSEREQQLEDARQAAVELADSAWDLLDATRRSRDALNEEIHQQTVAVAGVKHDQSLGLRTIFEVISQEQSLFQSRINLVQAQRDAIIYEAALLRAVGELTAESLNLPVDLYDPQKNLDVVHHEWFGFHTAE